jgi:tRNA (mo5U34)-methyltransferase
MAFKHLLRRGESRLPRSVSAELEAELRSPLPWMYPWQLTPAVAVDLEGSELPSVHATRSAMIEPVVREALAAAGPDATVLDLGCNEGWFAHRALEWGAARVVGLDVREANVRRASLIQRHFGIDPERLRFERADVFALDAARLGTFDVVLVLGLIYHLENPVGALRVARALTRGTAVVESQLTAHDDPIRLGWGATGVFRSAPGHWAAVLEPADEQQDDGNPLASFGGVVSLVPNRTALVEALDVAGFRDVRMLDAPAHLNPQYVEGHRGIAVGRVPR